MLEDMSNSIVALAVPNMDSYPINEERQIEQQIPRELHRSRGIIQQPDRFMFSGEALETEAIGHKDDHFSYNEAMGDVDKNLWKKAMNVEMELMGSNKVWELVDLLEGIKPIGRKWVYKRKRGADGKVETFKTRLVVKGYIQKEGIDYDETFSPIAMLKSIHILLSFVAALDYKTWQMDVKTTILNGHLEESIYMVQPNKFKAKYQKNKVCKFLKSIYRLKQASYS